MSMRSRQINLDCFSKHMNERVNIYLAKIKLSFGRHWWTLNIKYQIISAAIIVPSQLLLDRKELLKSSYFYRYEISSRLSSFHKTNVTVRVTRKMKHTSVVKVQTFPCQIMPTLKSIYICICLQILKIFTDVLNITSISCKWLRYLFGKNGKNLRIITQKQTINQNLYT